MPPPLFFAEGRLRPIWRALISLLVILGALPFVVGVLLGAIEAAAGGYLSTVAIYFAATFLTLPLVLGLYKIFMLVWEDRPLGAVGIAFCGRWKSELSLGVGLGTVMMLGVGSLERMLGAAHFSWTIQPAPQVLRSGAILLVMLVGAAANEELSFRGYPFQRLAEATGAIPAVAVFSALFGSVHLQNPDHSWFSTLNTMLVGVTLAVAYLRTRSLWLPIGLHFSWNFVQGFVLGLPVSGIFLANPLLQAKVSGPVWLTGGGYGPEGGVLTTVVVVLATVYLLLSKSIYTSKEMEALVFGPTTPEITPLSSSESSGNPGESSPAGAKNGSA